MSQPPQPPLSRLLPYDAAKLLQQAAQTPVTRADPLARVKAIEKATERVKHAYPYYFIKETETP